MYGKIQESGLTEIHFVCMSAILGQYPLFFHILSSLGAHRREWLQSWWLSDHRYSSSWVHLGLASSHWRAEIANDCDILVYWQGRKCSISHTSDPQALRSGHCLYLYTFACALLLLPLSCSPVFEPSAPVSFPRYSKMVLVAHLEIFAQPILPSSCGCSIWRNHYWSKPAMTTTSPTGDWSGQGLMIQFWQMRYERKSAGVAVRAFPSWKERHGQGRRCLLVFGLSTLPHTMWSWGIPPPLWASAFSSAKQGSREKEVLEPPQLWHTVVGDLKICVSSCKSAYEHHGQWPLFFQDRAGLRWVHNHI